MTDDKRTTSPAAIRKAIGSPHISGPFNGGGYWYLVYDDGDVCESQSAWVYRMSSLTLAQWAAEGRELIQRVAEIKERLAGAKA